MLLLTSAILHSVSPLPIGSLIKCYLMKMCLDCSLFMRFFLIEIADSLSQNNVVSSSCLSPISARIHFNHIAYEVTLAVAIYSVFVED